MENESKRDYQRRYRAANPEKFTEYNRKYRMLNIEKEKLKHEKWLSHKDNIEKVRARSREWNCAHKEIVNSRKKKWIIDNPEKVRIISDADKEKRKKYYKEHRETILENNRAWSRNNHEKTRMKSLNRRALKNKNGGKNTEKEWIELKSFYNNKCLCCGRSESEIKIALDHVVPLISGGKNVIENAQPLCGSCNSKKGRSQTDFRNNIETI